MKKLKLLVFFLSICSCSAFAQIEIKTGPLNLIFVAPVPDLYVEHVVTKNIGVEYGIGLIDNCTDMIYCDITQKGVQGLIAAKYYMFAQGIADNLYVGLYARLRKVEFTGEGVVLRIEEEFSIGTGLMGGYKLVGKKGFLMEISMGVHSNALFKTKHYNPEESRGAHLRLMLGWRFNRNKLTGKDVGNSIF